MASGERVFKVTINGLEESYNNVIKLNEALEKIPSVTSRVNVETEKSTTVSKEKSSALNEEDKAIRKLEQTLARKESLDTDLGRLQVEANQQARERSQLLSRQIQLENAETGSIDEKRLQIASLSRTYRALSEEERNSAQIGGAMLSQIQELRAEYNDLERSMGNHTVVVGNYENANKGLQGSLNSLSETLNSTSENTKGMLNIFQAGVGIALLFDDENSELQKTMNNLGKVMAIIGALQSVNNSLLQKGVIASKAAAVMEGIHAIQVRARAVAIALATKNTLAATIAQKAFNIVANANPYVLLAVALVTVIGALAAFAIGTDNATEKQREHNEIVQNSIELKEQYLTTMKQLSDANLAQIQRELDLLKARGASESQLALKQRQIYEERLKYSKQNTIQRQREIADIEKNTEKVRYYTLEIEKLNKGLLDGTYKNNDAFKEKKETLEQYLQIYSKYLNIGIQAQEEERKAQSDLDNFNAEQAKKAAELGRKNAQSLAEYRVLMAQKGSKAELQARIDAANQQLRNDLASTDITNGERLKKTRETLLQIRKLESDYRKYQYQEELDMVDVQLDSVKKGSSAEYSLMVDRLRSQKKIDLENTELTAIEKLKIESKYNSDLAKLTKEYTDRITEEGLQSQISAINARLAYVKSGSEEEFNLQKDLLSKNAELAKEQADASIMNEELKSAKIKEINANLQKDLVTLSLNQGLSRIDAEMDVQTSTLLSQLSKRKINRREYEEEVLKITADGLQKEIDLRKSAGENVSDLENKLAETNIDIADNVKNQTVNKYKEMAEKIQKYTEDILTVMTPLADALNTYFDDAIEDANDKLDSISKKYDEVVEKREESSDRLKELEDQQSDARGGNLLILKQQIADEIQTNNQLAAEESRLSKEKEKQEKEIAKKERQQKKVQVAQDIIQAISNTALGATKAMEWGFPLGPIFAAIISAAGAVQVGIMTKQLAKFEDGGILKGKRHSQGGMRIEGTNIEVEGGEYVVNRESTNKNLGLLQHINSKKRELSLNDISSYFSSPNSSMESVRSSFASGGQLPVVENSIIIDNGAVVDAIESLDIKPVVSVVDIARGQSMSVKVEDITGI